jgi:hypothetical protein
MTVKPLAVFTADFPDDQVEDETDIVLYGGRNVAEAIRELAIKFGCDAPGLLYEGVKGWSFEASHEGRAYICLITSFHPRFFLIVDAGLAGRFAEADFVAFLEAMNAVLLGDGRFHELQWYENGDAPDPWQSELSPDGPTAAQLGAAVKERVRRVRRDRRRANWGCLIAIASAVAILIGAMEAIQGTVYLLVNKVGGDQLLVGLLLLLIGGFGVWTLHRWSKTPQCT